MQHDSVEKLKKHYRNAWIGTFAGFGFILLLILFAGEVGFSERFLGPRIIRKVAFNLAAGSGFLAFLILYDRPTTESIDRIRIPLIVGAVSYLLWFWMLGLTNRIGRNDLQYDRQVTVENIALRSEGLKSIEESIPSHWYLRVRDEAGRLAAFKGPLDQFNDGMRGKQITLPVVRGRWGQDFIAPLE